MNKFIIFLAKLFMNKVERELFNAFNDRESYHYRNFHHGNNYVKFTLGGKIIEIYKEYAFVKTVDRDTIEVELSTPLLCKVCLYICTKTELALKAKRDKQNKENFLEALKK